MSTPISRARVALRAIHRLRRGVERDVEAGQADVDDAAAAEAAAGDRLAPLLPRLQRDSLARVGSGESPAGTPSSGQPQNGGEESKFFRSMSNIGYLQNSQSQRSHAASSVAEDSHQSSGYFAPVKDAKAISGLIFSSYLNILLLSVPAGFMAQALGWSASLRFSLNFLSLVPLALLLGEVTEDLAIRFGDVIGGLLNATFGNIVELILSLAALQKGLYDVVAMSLVGSVLSNLLLVLGCCFLVGGTQYHSQSFNAGFNKAMCSLLFLACIAVTLPTATRSLYPKAEMSDALLLSVSHYIAILLILAYACYLLFQLKTHREDSASAEDDGGDASDDGTDKQEETSSLSLSGALAMLTVITILVAFASEFLTGSIEEVSEGSGISKSFLGLIVLPIAGNACEHITAVFVAAKNKMDLAIGVALGSSIQIAIFVLPFVVLAGWATGNHFSLALDPLSVIILTLSVIHATFVSSDGNSNWLLGVQLIGTYILIGILYFYMV